MDWKLDVDLLEELEGKKIETTEYFCGFLDIVWSEFGGYDVYLLDSYYCWLKLYILLIP